MQVIYWMVLLCVLREADARSATEQAARINWAREVLYGRLKHENEQNSHSRDHGAKAPDSQRKAAGGSLLFCSTFGPDDNLVGARLRLASH